MTATTLAPPRAATEADLSPPSRPRWAGVLREQMRTVAGALRWQAILGAAALAFLTLIWVLDRMNSPGPSDMQFVEMIIPLATMALFTPSEVWRGEQPSRRGYFWAMPVERTSHTLLRVLAGWAWLMAAVAVFLAWVTLASWASGGTLSLGDTRVLLHALPDTVKPTPADYFFRAWPVPAWQWIVPFAAATTLYLLGSIAPLASNYPWRWYGGMVLAVVLAMSLGKGWPERTLYLLVPGPFGLEALITGGAEREFLIASPAGGQVRATAYAPTPGAWLSATALWMSISLAGVLIAARRHRDS